VEFWSLSEQAPQTTAWQVRRYHPKLDLQCRESKTPGAGPFPPAFVLVVGKLRGPRL